jgi:leader peptidase (prepilin peptidase)/N-methyltransferase
MWISPRYPLIELLNGLLFVLVYWVEVPAGWSATLESSGTFAVLGPQIIPDGLSPVAWLNWRYAYHMVLIEALVVATFIDFDHMIIPDGCTLPAMLVGVVGGFALAQVFLVPVWFQEPEIARMLSPYTPGWLERALGPMTVPQVDWTQNQEFLGRAARLEIPVWVRTFPHLHGLAVSMAGLVIGGGIVWVLRIIGQFVLKREAMGFGDVVLMATIGSFLGWQPVVTVFFVAPVCALAVLAIQRLAWLLHSTWRVLRKQATTAQSRRGPREIPYGPYLSLAALLTLLGWKHIWPVAQWWFAFGPIVLIAFVVIPAAMFASLQLFQGIKRLLGVPLYDEELARTAIVEEWTPADQLIYLQGENVDRLRGRWMPQHDWPGTAAARGTAQVERWRNGAPR